MCNQGNLTHPNSDPADTTPYDGVVSRCRRCITYTLATPFLVAIAKDDGIKNMEPSQIRTLSISSGIPSEARVLEFGQDTSYSFGASARPMPFGYIDIGDEQVLKNTMLGLLDDFAQSDDKGVAQRLFDRFLAKNNEIEIFEDAALNQSVEQHENFIAFSERTLNSPVSDPFRPSVRRIHQVLKEVNWNINRITTPLDELGVLSFNLNFLGDNLPHFLGDLERIPLGGDHATGLKVMINGVQHVLVYVMDYSYDSCNIAYDIKLRFVVYDVFGLDDEDLMEFGAIIPFGSFPVLINAARHVGFNAWWQLQHQYGYAPLITKAIVDKTYKIIPTW